MMFGGLGLSGATNELWEWDGVRWTLLKAETPPPGDYLYDTLTYDETRDVLVVHGTEAPPSLSTTWEWDAVSGWRVARTDGPALAYRKIVFDRHKGVPANVTLLGAPFYQQVVSLDPGVNAFGAVMSDVAAGVVGSR